MGLLWAQSTQAIALERILGGFLILYVLYLVLNPGWMLPQSRKTAVGGGLLSGFFAGLFWVGGAVRGAFLTAFNLPQEVYIFTSGVIALLIDITRVSRYIWGGTRLEQELLLALLVSIPISFLGAYLAKKFLDRLPRSYFRMLVGIFLALVGIKLLIWG